jgi:hypothetical protein
MEIEGPGGMVPDLIVRRRTLPEPKISEATENVEKHLQVCISHNSRSPNWHPL